MARHESVTDDFVALLRLHLEAGFMALAAVPVNQTETQLITMVYPFQMALSRVPEGWTKEEIQSEVNVRNLPAQVTIAGWDAAKPERKGVETFYKQEASEDQLQTLEYQALVIAPVIPKLWAVRQLQGWWREEEKKPVAMMVQLSTLDDPWPKWKRGSYTRRNGQASSETASSTDGS